jgi:hypothetical protein
MNIEERIRWVQQAGTVLSGTMEQASTPLDVIQSMFDEIPDNVLKSNSLVDPYCGRGPILLEGVLRKFLLEKTGDETVDQEVLSKIVSDSIFGNDFDPQRQTVARASLKRLGLLPDATVNVDNVDGLLYNKPMPNSISVTNPPYQPPRGVKKGGNEYKKHVIKSITDYPTYGVANIPMTFMVQDPFDAENNKFKKFLLDQGLKKIKHIRPDAYAANVLTVYIVWEQGYQGPVEFQTYDVDDVSKFHTLSVDRSQMYSIKVWPVARTQKEFDLAKDVLSYAKKSYKFFQSDPAVKSPYCVDWEYLIGLEKERLNRKINIRNLKLLGPTDTVRGKSLSRFYNCVDQAEAQSLFDFLNTTGQEFMMTIPRGSSLENWMIGPLIEMWKARRSSLLIYEEETV